MSNRKADQNGKATRFSTTNQPKNKGRKPSLYNQLKELAKIEGYIDLSKDDFSRLTALLLGKSLKELNAIQQDQGCLQEELTPHPKRRFLYTHKKKVPPRGWHLFFYMVGSWSSTSLPFSRWSPIGPLSSSSSAHLRARGSNAEPSAGYAPEAP